MGLSIALNTGAYLYVLIVAGKSQKARLTRKCNSLRQKYHSLHLVPQYSFSIHFVDYENTYDVLLYKVSVY